MKSPLGSLPVAKFPRGAGLWVDLANGASHFRGRPVILINVMLDCL